jgi:N-acetylmuramoyl-L-alanine amidase
MMGLVQAVVVHYLQAPGWTPKRARDYFESLKTGREARSASAHYVVGPDEVLYIVPKAERAYHCGSGYAFPQGYTQWSIGFFRDYPNDHTIGIECCHADASGRFEAATVDNLVEVCALLCEQYALRPMEHIVRHFDVTAKRCPLWWVEHEEEFNWFRCGVADMVQTMRSRGRLWHSTASR